MPGLREHDPGGNEGGSEMSLYQLTKEYEALYAQIDEIPEDAFADTLEGLQGEFSEKADNLACFIKSLKAEADDIKAEAAALKEREAAKRAKADRLRAYLLQQMAAVGLKKIESSRNVITVAKAPAKLVVDDGFTRWAEEQGRNDLLTYKTPEPNKTAIKDAVRAGNEIPFVRMEDEGQSLRIK